MSKLRMPSLAAPPSAASFRQLCAELEAVTEGEIGAALPPVCAQLASWPPVVRRAHLSWYEGRDSGYFNKQRAVDEGGPLQRWLWELLDGVYNPRLVVLDSLSLSCDAWFPEGHWEGKWGQQSDRSLVLALAQRFEPTFAIPAQTGSSEERSPGYEHDYTTYGDRERGLVVDRYTVEHAGDYTFGYKYEVRGLCEHASVTFDSSSRSGNEHVELSAFGPAPAAIDVALAWGRVLVEGPQLLDLETVGQIGALLRAAR